MSNFEKDLRSLLNTYSAENDSDTPDYILAKYLMSCLSAYNEAVQSRDSAVIRDDRLHKD